jgi:hypothetical protein
MTVFKEITNEDIYRELQEIKEMGIKTHDQACKTNGRVSVLEKKSLGMWISQNPLRFALFLLVFFSIIISDIRHPLVESLIKFFL